MPSWFSVKSWGNRTVPVTINGRLTSCNAAKAKFLVGNVRAFGAGPSGAYEPTMPGGGIDKTSWSMGAAGTVRRPKPASAGAPALALKWAPRCGVQTTNAPSTHVARGAWGGDRVASILYLNGCKTHNPERFLETAT